MRRRPTFLLLLACGTLLGGEIADKDRRNTEIRHTDTQFQLPVFESRESWEQRAASLRRQVRFAAGLLPFPEKTPLKPQVFGKLEREGYSIEKVLLETFPGFYLGGNLYRPNGKEGPFPAIVSPHGHWRYGRLEHQPLGSVPARAINLARQGYVVFTYDMVGYNDTRQLPHKALGGKELELWGVGLLGVQLWNSIRAVDFLQSLSDVDPDRIAATGASGGGTQTFLLTAVDERVRWSAPVNMVSAIMQGGSVCENAPNLRIDTNNVELAALAAPRPMLLVSATGDWTKNVPKEEFPAIQRIYALEDARERVEVVQFDSPHNYHRGSREAVYRFFGERILEDDDPERFAEKDVAIEQLSDMLALWAREAPANALSQEEFVSARIRKARERIAERKPRDRASLAKAAKFFREQLALALMASAPEPENVVHEVLEDLPRGEKLVLGRQGHGDRIPAVLLRPRRLRSGVRPIVLIHPEGGAWALSSRESRSGLVADALGGGAPVLAIDVFQTAHAVAPRTIATANARAERYYTTFNRTDTAHRVQDVLTAAQFARRHFETEEINLACLGEAGLWCALARALLDGPVRLFADLHHFEPSDTAFVERLFVPHLRKAGGFQAAAALSTNGSATLWSVNDAFPADWYEASFRAAEPSGALEIRSEALGARELAAALTAR